jgi:hypothetical protein
MGSRFQTQAKVAQNKAAHPELFCPEERCLWRTGGGRCPRHSPPTTEVEYERIHHAAHTGDGSGWDLDQWDAAQHFEAPRPACVPIDATKDRGYIAIGGVHHQVWLRKAPLGAEPCDRCRPEVAHV